MSEYAKTSVVGLALAFFAQGAVAQDTKIGVLNALQALFNSDAAQVVQTELEQEFALDEAARLSLQSSFSLCSQSISRMGGDDRG